ncbi:MAG: glycosyltransferase [Chthoniobacterales bacterium]
MSQGDPRLSIIIPTLQEEKALGTTLAALKFSFPHEVIVSDGGSIDRTVAIAREFADEVLVHQGSERQTIAQGRNAGARVARGEFLVFFDADCSVENPDEFFPAAVAKFEADPKLVALTARLRVLPEQETFGDKLVFGLTDRVTRFRSNVLKKGDAQGGEFQMVRAAVFHSLGGYREDLVTCEDRDLFARLARVGRVRSDPQLTVFHTGRRAHNVGWPRLIVTFLANTISFRLRGKAFSKEWSVER